MEGSERQDPGIGGVVLLAIGVAGFTMCLTLLYHGMRDVMDIGGYCAEGGPYVIQNPCPEGTIPATMLGTFGMFLFGAIAMAGSFKVGGYGWLLIAGWTALFAALGWNFLAYGLIDPPDGEVQWGWLIPGVLFQLMAWVPAAFVVKMRLDERRFGGTGPVVRAPEPELNTLRGPSQPPQPATGAPDPATAEASAIRRDLAADMGALIVRSAAVAPVDVAGDGTPSVAPAGFSEGTQALLDRLERLADMRDRGLLDPDEYETAKEAIVRELETRR